MHTENDGVTAELKEAFDAGWNAYWEGNPNTDCPNYAFQEARDEWMAGWFSASGADE